MALCIIKAKWGNISQYKFDFYVKITFTELITSDFYKIINFV